MQKCIYTGENSSLLRFGSIVKTVVHHMAAVSSLPPGFRFHPTDEELVAYYLKRKINGRKIDVEVIPEVDLYKCEPWDLPGKSLLPSKDLEWYFFSPRDRKYPNGSRTNRATKAGYWKATGKDRMVTSQTQPIGTKKTLVYYSGRAPHGSRSGWVMHEYRLDERECGTNTGLQDVYALCRVFKKSLNAPKMEDRYVASTSNNRSFNFNHLYSEGRYDYSDLDYRAPVASSATLNIARSTRHISEESYVDYPYSNCAPIPHPPSKVDLALERVRLQPQFSLPPGEYSDNDNRMSYYSSALLHNNNMHQPADILEEILSIAQESQALHNNNGDAWCGLNSYNPIDDFSFVPDSATQENDLYKSTEEPNQTSIVISDKEHVSDETARMVENLSWVGMISNEELDKVFSDEFEENISIELLNDNNACNHIFSSNDEVDDDGDIDGFSTSRNFDEVFEKVEVNHGLLVLSRQAPKTFYCKAVPSTTVKVHVSPAVLHRLIRLEELNIIKITPERGSFSNNPLTHSRNVLRNMNLKAIRGPRFVEDGEEDKAQEERVSGNNILRPYFTFALALCAICVQIVVPFY